MKAKKVFNTIFIVLFLLIMGFFAFKVFFMEDESILNDIYPTENVKEAYAEDGDEAFLYTNVTCDISSDGYYNAYAFLYIPSKNEIQVTTKYNDSLLNVYMEGANVNDFVWELRDENGNTLSVGKMVDSTEKYYYNYQRIVFENIEIKDDSVLVLQLVDDAMAYPTEDTKKTNFVLYTYEDKLSKYKLSSDEKKLLGD